MFRPVGYSELRARRRIGVEKSSSHRLSRNEIGDDNPCSRHLSESIFGNGVNQELTPLAAIAGRGNLSEVRQFKVELRGVKSDRKLLLFSSSILIFMFSFVLPLLSVHTYCENRSVAAAFGFGSIAVLVFLLRGQAASTARAVASGVGVALCVLAVVLNVAFILYATHLCRHMFDELL